MSSPLNTTTTRALGRAFVAAVVGALVSWVTTKVGKFNTGMFAALMPVLSGAYYAAVTALEKKFPNLGWLLGTLPQPKVVVTPEPTPAPAPVKATAKKVAPAKKAAPKN